MLPILFGICWHTAAYYGMFAAILMSLFYVLGTWRYTLFQKLNVPAPRPLPFIGNLVGMMWSGGMHYYEQKLISEYGPVVGYYLGAIPMLVCADVDLLKQVMIKEAAIFTDRMDFGVNGYPLRKAITVLSGDDWKRVRSLLTPTFTSGKIRAMTPLMRDAIVTLVKKLESAADSGEEIDMKNWFSGMTLEVIASTMFGMKVACQVDKNDPFLVNGTQMFKRGFANPLFFFILLFPETAPLLRRLQPSGFIPAKIQAFFIEAVESAIAIREKSSDTYHDFLSLMLKAHKEPTPQTLEADASLDTSDAPIKSPDSTEQASGNVTDTAGSRWGDSSLGLSNEEILAQSFIFFLAGFETTASTLNFCSYFLARNLNIQDRLRKEIKEKLEDEELTYESVAKMPFLEQCINETLRLCPPAVRLDRVGIRDVILSRGPGQPPLRVPKGVPVGAPIFALQHDPAVWDSPEEFRPERFDPVAREGCNPFYFMPFGMGPRNCIGMRFALLELKMALASAIQHVRFLPTEKTPEKLEFRMLGLTQPVKPIILRTERA